MRAAAVFVLALTWVASAQADIGLVSISRTSARPGAAVVARFGGYANEWPRMPVYLVRSGLGPGVPSPKVKSAPTKAPYVWLGRIHYAPPTSGRFAFRVPRITPGSYHFVVYCAPCFKGPGGSLITTGPTFRVLG